MNDTQKTRQQLLEELAELRRQLADKEAQLARGQQAEVDQQQVNDNLPVLVATAGVDGYYKEVNAAFERILGWSQEESLSRPFMDFIHPDDRAAAVVTFDRLKSGETVTNFVDRNICKDGSHRWIDWTVIPLLDRGIVFGIGQDITECKQTETALRESERRLSRLMSNLPGAVYRCKADSNWTIEFLSDGYRSITGYEPSTLIGQPGTRHSDLIHPDDRQREFDTVMEAVGRKEKYQVEYRLRTASDDEKWLWEQGEGVFSEDGELEAIEGFTTDITRRKQAESDLRKTHEQLEQRVQERTAELRRSNEELQIFKTFAEASAEGFGMSDMDGKIVYANAALACIVGEAKPEDMLGKHPSVYYSDDYPMSRQTEIHPVVERDGFWQGELTMVSVSGERIPVLQTSFTLVDEDKEPVRRGVVVTDLRAIKEAEEDLRQNEAKYRALVESSPDAVIMTDLTGQILFASKEAAAWYGADDPQEMTDRSVLTFVPKDERDRLQEHIRLLAEEGVVKEIEYTCLRRDGTTYPAEASSAVIRDGSGEPIALMAVYRDITERKQTRVALKREQDALRRMLQASDNDRKLITYEIHDGVAQRLAGALMHFQAVSQRDSGVAKEARADFEAGLAAVREASAEGRSLMNRTRTPVLQRFGIRPAIADFIDQFAERPNSPEITYHCEARFRRLEPVLETQIFRVAQEAIANACIHSKSELVHVKLIQDEGDLILEVQDSGIGFDTSQVAEGRFGLHGIRERTRLLGKELKIESTPGIGTLVRAKFPLIYKDEQADQ